MEVNRIIGVDLRCLPSDGAPGAGVAHASRSLVNRLISEKVEGVTWTLYLPKGASPNAEQRLLRERTADTRIVRIENSSGASLRRAIVARPCDLLFVPSGAVAPALSVPVVPWVHDVDIFEHPEWFPEPFLRRQITTRLFRRGVERAKHILTASKATSTHLSELFGIPMERMTITSEGGDDVLSALQGGALHDAKARAKFRMAERGITNPYILVLGTLEPRKNLPMIIQAWADARKKFRRPFDLVVVGRDGWKLGPITGAIDVAKSYTGEGMSRFHRLEAPTDDDRRDIELAAEIVVVPSFSEGFGLVALEGMQAGAMVVASSAGALPEVVGDAGILLPPEDQAAWTQTLVNLVKDDETRRHFAELGKSRSQGMTWARSAEIACRVLTEAANSGTLAPQKS